MPISVSGSTITEVHEESPTLSFCVIGPPVPKERPRVVAYGGKIHAYTPTRTVAYETLVAGYAQRAIAMRYQRLRAEHPEVPASQHAWPMSSFYQLTCRFYTDTRGRKDLDNMIKSGVDALNGIVWDDDWRVVDLVAMRRVDRVKPRAEITIQVIPDPFPISPPARKKRQQAP